MRQFKKESDLKVLILGDNITDKSFLLATMYEAAVKGTQMQEAGLLLLEDHHSSCHKLNEYLSIMENMFCPVHRINDVFPLDTASHAFLFESFIMNYRDVDKTSRVGEKIEFLSASNALIYYAAQPSLPDTDRSGTPLSNSDITDLALDCDRLRQCCRDADVIMITVDSVILSRFCSLYERTPQCQTETENIIRLLRSTLVDPWLFAKQGVPHDKMILFAPVKCEHCYHSNNPKYMPELLTTIERLYSPFISRIRDNTLLRNSITIATLPVLILGNLAFSHMASTEDTDSEYSRLTDRMLFKYRRPVEHEENLAYDTYLLPQREPRFGEIPFFATLLLRLRKLRRAQPHGIAAFFACFSAKAKRKKAMIAKLALLEQNFHLPEDYPCSIISDPDLIFMNR